MKLLLAIETSSRDASVALVGPDGILGEHAESNGGRTENLHRLMVGLFAELGRSAAEVDGVAVSIGPGSFTGTRIGLAVGKGVALANRCPLVGVSVPHALAFASRDPGGIVEIWLDVGRGEIHRTVARGGAVDAPGRTAPVDECLSLARRDGSTRFIGSGAVRCRDRIRNAIPGAAVGEGEANVLRAGAIGVLGWREITAGGGLDWKALEPLYARPADAKLPPGVPDPQGDGA